MSEETNLVMSHEQSLDEDQISINSPVTDDEQSSMQMTISSGRLVARKHIFRKRPSLFGRFQVDRLSKKNSGATLRNNSDIVEKKMQRDSEDDNSDEENRGSVKGNRLQESFEDNSKTERLSVQDIINYFESKAETGDSASKDLETSIRRSSTFAIPEKLADRRWSGVSSASSQISIDDRTSISAEACSSAYEYIHEYGSQLVEHAHTLDVVEDNFKYEKEDRGFDENSLAISDDVVFSSQGSWSRLQSSTIASSSCYDFDDDIVRSSIDSKGVHANDVTSGYESDLKMEQYLLAYDNKRRFKSEMMRLPAGNLTEEGESFKDLAKYEAELVDDINESNRINANRENVAAEKSIVVPECRGVTDPVLQAHVYVTEDLDQLMTQWNTLRKAEQSDLSDSFIVPARSLPNKPTDSGRKTDLNIEAIESLIDNVKNDSSYSNTKQKDEEWPSRYDDLFMMPERSFGRDAKSDNRSRIYPLDTDIKLTNKNIYDIHQSSRGKEENSDVRIIEQQKLETQTLKKEAKTSDSKELTKDLEQKGSPTPVRRVISSIKGTESASRGGNLIPWNANRSTKAKEETRKRFEDTRLQGRNRMPAQRNSLASAKAVDPLPRASSSHVAFVKPKVATKPPPSSSNTAGKGAFSIGNVTSDISRSAARNSYLSGRTSLQKQAPNAVNRTSAVNAKLQHSHSVPCSLEVKKDNDRKPLPGRNHATSMPLQSLPSQLRKPQDKSTKLGIRSAFVGASAVKPRSVGKLSSTASDTRSHGITKGTL